MRVNGLTARLEKLEQQQEQRTIPPIILIWLKDGETQEAARVRELGRLGIRDRPGLPVAFLDSGDMEVL